VLVVEEEFKVNSMEALAKTNRFQAVGTASLISLIVAGYMTLAGTAFLSFNERRAPASHSVEDTGNATPALVCDCHYENPETCATN